MFKKTLSLLSNTAIAITLGAVSASADTKIGVLVPDSGPAGLFGPSTRNSAMLAADHINASGGINGEQIELIFADVGVPPAEAAQAALRLWKGQGAEAFVGMHVGKVGTCSPFRSTVSSSPMGRAVSGVVGKTMASSP